MNKEERSQFINLTFNLKVSIRETERKLKKKETIKIITEINKIREYFKKGEK